MESLDVLEALKDIVDALDLHTNRKQQYNICVANNDNHLFGELIKYLTAGKRRQLTENRLNTPLFCKYVPSPPDSLQEWLKFAATRTDWKDDYDVKKTREFIKSIPPEIQSDYKKILCNQINILLDKEDAEEIFTYEESSQ